MKIALAKQMREIDQIAIHQYGIPEIVLMENAGVAVAKIVKNFLVDFSGKKVAIFAGKGNNGGDAFVVARHLHNCGIKVKVYIVGNAEKICGSSKINLDILQNMNIDILQVSSERDWDKVKIGVAFSDLLIDGLLGTGFNGELSAEMVKIINIMNDSQKLVVAIDVPSGVSIDTGKVLSSAVRANVTVTFGLPKIGLLLYPGASYAGKIEIIDIGLPNELLKNEHIKQNMVNDNMVKRLLTKRLADAHKGSCGRVLVIAGSRGMTGAACLVSRAAMRSGAGVVTLAIAESLYEIVDTKLTEVMTYPLPEIEKGVLGESALPILIELARNYDVVEIGSGLGRHPETLKFIQAFVQQVDKQLIIDADAIHACAPVSHILASAKIMPILTPHLGEMSALTKYSVQQIKDNFISIARDFALRLNAIIILKNARTVVAYPDGNVYINTKGNAGMATAGSGDVLAGVVSGIFAQGVLSYSAAVAGVYLHALAGDLAAESGMVGLMANDIVEKLPVARLNMDSN